MRSEPKKDGACYVLSSRWIVMIVRKIVETRMIIAIENLTGNYGLEFRKIKDPSVDIGITTNTDLQMVTVAMKIGAPAINLPIGGFRQIFSEKTMGRIKIKITCNGKHSHLF
jgi:hypothetical protein